MFVLIIYCLDSRIVFYGSAVDVAPFFQECGFMMAAGMAVTDFIVLIVKGKWVQDSDQGNNNTNSSYNSVNVTAERHTSTKISSSRGMNASVEQNKHTEVNMSRGISSTPDSWQPVIIPAISPSQERSVDMSMSRSSEASLSATRVNQSGTIGFESNKEFDMHLEGPQGRSVDVSVERHRKAELRANRGGKYSSSDSDFDASSAIWHPMNESQQYQGSATVAVVGAGAAIGGAQASRPNGNNNNMNAAVVGGVAGMGYVAGQSSGSSTPVTLGRTSSMKMAAGKIDKSKIGMAAAAVGVGAAAVGAGAYYKRHQGESMSFNRARRNTSSSSSISSISSDGMNRTVFGGTGNNNDGGFDHSFNAGAVGGGMVAGGVIAGGANGGWNNNQNNNNGNWNVNNSVNAGAVGGGMVAGGVIAGGANGGWNGGNNQNNNNNNNGNWNGNNNVNGGAIAGGVIAGGVIAGGASNGNWNGGNGNTNQPFDPEWGNNNQINRPNSWWGFWAMSWTDQMHSKWCFMMMMLERMLTGLITGFAFWCLGNDQMSIEKRQAALFFCVTNQALFGAIMTATSFSVERTSMLIAGAYGRFSFYSASMSVEMLFHAGFAMIFSLASYFLIELQQDASNFFIFYGFMFGTSMVASSITFFVSSMCRSTNMTLSVFPFLAAVPMLFGMYYVDPVPSYFTWLESISFVRYSYSAVAINEFKGLRFTCQPSEMLRNGTFCPTMSGSQFLREHSLDSTSMGWCAGVLAIIFVVMRFLAFIRARSSSNQNPQPNQKPQPRN